MYNKEHQQGATGVHKMPVAHLKILISGVFSIISSFAIVTRGYRGTSAHGLYKGLNILGHEIRSSFLGLGHPDVLSIQGLAIPSNMARLPAFKAKPTLSILSGPVSAVEFHWFRLWRQAGIVSV